MEKLLKTNTTVWFNRMCRFNHLMPKYIHVTVSSNNANNRLISSFNFPHQNPAKISSSPDSILSGKKYSEVISTFMEI